MVLKLPVLLFVVNVAVLKSVRSWTQHDGAALTCSSAQMAASSFARESPTSRRCAGLFCSVSSYQWARQEKLDTLEDQWSSPATQEQLQLVREIRHVPPTRSSCQLTETCPFSSTRQ